MQHVWVGCGQEAQQLTLPEPTQEVFPGVPWGCASSPFSPAYWIARCSWPLEDASDFVTKDGSLTEELGFCLLGGFGIRYEVNTAAFERLREKGVFSLECDFAMSEIEDLLLTPLMVDGRNVRYRFPRQRARRLWKMREVLRASTISLDDPLSLRDELMELEGVGPKTASWVVRNLLGSDQVAILDVHIIRVCQRLGLFPRNVTLPRDYRKLEEIFLDFASVAGVSSAQLDATIWAEARTVPADAWRLT